MMRTYVAMFPAIPCRVGPHETQRPWRARWSSRSRIFPMSTTSKARWWKCGSPVVDERHHVVLGVDVEPDAGLAEPVGDPHPEHVRVERDVRVDRAGQAVDVPEPARPADVHGRRGARVLRPAVLLARRRAVRHELDRAAVRVGEPERALALLVVDRRAPRGGRARRRASTSGGARTRRGRGPARSPATSSSEYGSSLQARNARPSSRERSTSPSWMHQRAAASSRSRDAEADVVDAAEADQVVRPSSDPPLGLVLGDRERDVERLRRDLELLARPREVDVPLLDRVRQPAEPGDLDLDDVARPHRPRVRRRPGEDDVARLERDRAAEVGELVRDAGRAGRPRSPPARRRRSGTCGA